MKINASLDYAVILANQARPGTKLAVRMAVQGKAIKPARKRTMSPAAKKKMAALMKARWATAK